MGIFEKSPVVAAHVSESFLGSDSPEWAQLCKQGDFTNFVLQAAGASEGNVARWLNGESTKLENIVALLDAVETLTRVRVSIEDALAINPTEEQFSKAQAWMDFVIARMRARLLGIPVGPPPAAPSWLDDVAVGVPVKASGLDCIRIQPRATTEQPLQVFDIAVIAPCGTALPIGVAIANPVFGKFELRVDRRPFVWSGREIFVGTGGRKLARLVRIKGASNKQVFQHVRQMLIQHLAAINSVAS